MVMDYSSIKEQIKQILNLKVPSDRIYPTFCVLATVETRYEGQKNNPVGILYYFIHFYDRVFTFLY